MENWINKREDFVISKSRFTLKLRYNYYNMSRSNIFIPINQRKQMLEKNVRIYDIV